MPRRYTCGHDRREDSGRIIVTGKTLADGQQPRASGKWVYFYLFFGIGQWETKRAVDSGDGRGRQKEAPIRSKSNNHKGQPFIGRARTGNAAKFVPPKTGRCFVAYLFDGQRHTDAILFDEDHDPAGCFLSAVTAVTATEDRRIQRRRLQRRRRRSGGGGDDKGRQRRRRRRQKFLNSVLTKTQNSYRDEKKPQTK